MSRLYLYTRLYFYNEGNVNFQRWSACENATITWLLAVLWRRRWTDADVRVQSHDILELYSALERPGNPPELCHQITQQRQFTSTDWSTKAAPTFWIFNSLFVPLNQFVKKNTKFHRTVCRIFTKTYSWYRRLLHKRSCHTFDSPCWLAVL